MSAPNPDGLAADLPAQARKRLLEMRERRLFTSDLSVSEFLLVKQAGFEPLGLVMGTSIYHVAATLPQDAWGNPAYELTDMTRALHHARELAMTRMEEEADALGGDGIVGVRLTVNLALDPRRAQWKNYREWTKWAKRVGFRRPANVPSGGYFNNWEGLAARQWQQWCGRNGWTQIPLAPWTQPRGGASYAYGPNTAEFIAIGTAVRHVGGENFKNKAGRPFQSDLSGQDFWLLIQSGYRPVGFVMGNCVYYVPPSLMNVAPTQSCELPAYTHALYDAREIAIERLQDEAESLGATGIVGVTIAEKQHSWRTNPANVGNAALTTGEVIELFVIGTAVVPTARTEELGRTQLVLSANDPAPSATTEGEE